MSITTLYIVDNYLLTRVSNKRCFLNDESFKVIGDFSNAFDFLNAMKKQQADIVLTDINLADINGIKLTKILKDEYPETKVIVLTSCFIPQKIFAALSCGVAGFILKDDRKIDLKEAVKTVLNNQLYINLDVARLAFSSIPIVNIEDINCLYETNRLKNSLTARELEVLKILTAGKTNSQIAKEIIVSTNTAKAHVGSILTKLSVKDRVQAAVIAVKANLF